MPGKISLCIIKIEIDFDYRQDQMAEHGAASVDSSASNSRAQKERERDRGLRTTSGIIIESYENQQTNPKPPVRAILPTGSREVTPLEDTNSIDLPLSATNTEFPKEISFFSGNPFVEVTNGIIHLFKKNERKEVEDIPSSQLCLLAVPASLSCHDLLKFVAPCHEFIQHIRIIRDGSPNQFMVILEFRSNKSALEFYKTYNGAAYNSIEPDSVCHAVWVSNIEWGDDGLPPLGHTELPNCPVCLERMDESVDGVLTILCNHAFHANCLIKWGDSTCPVCRHVQTPELMENSVCMECEGNEALWICLICGHVGCGRYQGGHAAAHYRATNHTYAMQLGTSSVWDYAGDNFVHRLYQNKTDGKLVASQNPHGNGEEDDGKEKIDSMQLEFTYLLTSQLDTQRKYYEEKLNSIEMDWAKQRGKTDEILSKFVDMEQKIQILTREKSSLEKKINQNLAKLREAQKQLAEECQMTKALQDNQSTWQCKYAILERKFKEYQEKKELELTEVKEQLRDIMFYMDAQSKIAESDMKEEIKEGTVLVPPALTDKNGPSSNSSKKGRRKNK
ncbi:BRCA1-associated protein [Condylostylus longicornis]|uniref:BRCA1-associated protein n=1 Tax=Condylostylus longicornis TaxID=2530218 RepID=UPI00244DF102|nr:BRCA1-associated protein [Condylostylus longicornis]